ncbi:MAG TPA: Rieske (2Fe-2S) protein [Chloroflexota bacterium]|nr:Rieske (2Fe-2S) protein [Chloroflexota bacterium]
MFRPLQKLVEEQEWLDALGDPLQKYITSLFSNAGENGKQIKDLLNGTWLGHPLHPVITDVPIGAWTCTLVLDLIGSRRDDDTLETAADITLATGLAAAAGAAATGFTDWSDTYGKERKLGLLHGVTMTATFATYLLALLARLGGARRAGVLLSNTGYLLAAAGAYLGGDEVYDIGYGVNHTAFTHGPGEYTPVLPEGELAEGKPAKADVSGVSIVLVKIGSDIYALDDTCVHAGCSLAGGSLEGRSIICPCHGSQYDLWDGAVIHGPATMPEPAYDVRVRNGMIEVKQATA